MRGRCRCNTLLEWQSYNLVAPPLDKRFVDTGEIISDPQDKTHFDAALGWFGLGAYHAAIDELEQLPPTAKTKWNVLKLRCTIYRKAKRWDELQTLAESCC